MRSSSNNDSNFCGSQFVDDLFLSALIRLNFLSPQLDVFCMLLAFA